MKNENHRQHGKTGWTTFWTMVDAVIPELKGMVEEMWKNYVEKTGNFTVDGFLKYMEKLE